MMIVAWNIYTCMNIGIVVGIALLLYSGYKRGFLMKLLSIIGFVLVSFLAWWLSTPLARMLALYPKEQLPLQGTIAEGFLYEQFNRFMIFIILCLVFNIAILFLRPLFKAISKLPVVSTVNKIAGLLLGGLQGILCMFLLTLFFQLPFISQGRDMIDKTYLQYSEPMMDVLLFYAKEPLAQMQVLYDLIDQQKALTNEEIENIRTWLLDNHIEEDKVDAIVQTLRSKDDER